MRKTAVFVLAALLLLPAVFAKEKYREPLDRVIFVHYKDGTVKVNGRVPKAPTCYKLLGVKWKSLPISYVINPGDYDETFVTHAISDANNEWDSHTSATLFADYSVVYSATWEEVPEDVDFENEYFFAPYPEDDVIAVTNYWYTRVGKQIVDYDVMFNTYYKWKDCSVPGTDCSAAMDLQNIATHETGHGLGLGDIYSSACGSVTMFGYSSYGETSKRDLAQPDMMGLQKLYGI